MPVLALLLFLFLVPCGAQPAHPDDYMGYVTKHLVGADGYQRQILLAIQNMYTDLLVQRQPRVHPRFNNVTLYPISFSIPEELVVRSPPAKKKPIHLPHWAKPHTESQRYSTTEDADGEVAYYRSMSRASFSLTVKKGGWDCMRHLEILAAGSVPLFTDIALAPPSCLAAYPKRLLAAILGQPGLTIEGQRLYDHFNVTLAPATLDRSLYMVTLSALLAYTRTVLTTGAMASHLLSVMALPTPAKKVLYLTFNDPKLVPGRDYISHLHGDYMADTLLHGLKRLLGQGNVVDVDRRLPQYRTVDDFELRKFLRHRQDHYGNGFSYALRLFEADGVVDRTNLAQRIQDLEFDAVVFGEAHRGNLVTQALYHEVCRHYPPARVAAVWGGDKPPTFEQWPLVRAVVAGGCIKYLFSREIDTEMMPGTVPK